MNFTPIYNRILVEKIVQDKTAGGIYLAGKPKEEDFESSSSYEGVILATGPKTVGVKVGDRIAFPKHVGVPVEIDHKPYLMMKDIDVLCMLAVKPKVNDSAPR